MFNNWLILDYFLIEKWERVIICTDHSPSLKSACGGIYTHLHPGIYTHGHAHWKLKSILIKDWGAQN